MKFNFEQLVAATLLKFGSIDGFSLLFLTKNAEEDINIQYQKTDLNDLIGLIESKNGILQLKEGYSLDTVRDGTTIIERLKTIAGLDVLTYLEMFDYKELILRKVELSSLGSKQKCFFNSFEDTWREKLHNEGYIASYDDDGIEVEEITFRAQAYLYMIDNRSQVMEFSSALASVGVRTDLIESYLVRVLDVNNPNNYKLSFKDIIGYQKFLAERGLDIYNGEGRK